MITKMEQILHGIDNQAFAFFYTLLIWKYRGNVLVILYCIQLAQSQVYNMSQKSQLKNQYRDPKKQVLDHHFMVFVILLNLKLNYTTVHQNNRLMPQIYKKEFTDLNVLVFMLSRFTLKTLSLDSLYDNKQIHGTFLVKSSHTHASIGQGCSLGRQC